MCHAIRTLLVLAAVGVPAAVFAQPVVVIPKPGDGQWTVSYTRMFEKGDAATGTELHTSCKTLAAAKQEAASLQRWSQSMDANSSWRLKKIYIEGEDATAGPPKVSAPKTPSLFTAVEQKMERDKAIQDGLKDLGVGKTATGKFASDLLTNPGEALSKEVVSNGLKKAISVAEGEAKKKLEQQAADFLADPNAKLTEVKGKFGDYLSNVQGAYKRAKDAKEEMMGLTDTLAEKKFKEVNALVDSFNREAANAPPGLGWVSQLFPKLKPVGPDTVKAVDDWKAARKQQFDLEGRKEALDQKKSDLDRERDKLAEEWKALSAKGAPDPADPKVVRLREKLKEYQEKTTTYAKDEAGYRAAATELQAAAAKLHLRPSDPQPKPPEPKVAALPDPGTLGGYRGRVGQSFVFEVTGSVGGTVWGDGVYTDDSALSAAAVHAGVLQVGQKGVVKVTILSGYSSYGGGTRNGVRSATWGTWPGSFRVEAVSQK
jgi:hypothetical protein